MAITSAKKTFLLALALTLLVLYYLLGSVNVSFESSKGDWQDSEMLHKGREYKMIAAQFEFYKIECGAHDATLVRTTAQNPFNLFAWYNYWTDPKWLTAYQNARRSSYYRPPCNTGRRPVEGPQASVTRMKRSEIRDSVPVIRYPQGDFLRGALLAIFNTI